MGKQYNKIEKAKRRKNYKKRIKEKIGELAKKN